jgi:hypothetical protein
MESVQSVEIVCCGMSSVVMLPMLLKSRPQETMTASAEAFDEDHNQYHLT